MNIPKEKPIYAQNLAGYRLSLPAHPAPYEGQAGDETIQGGPAHVVHVEAGPDSLRATPAETS